MALLSEYLCGEMGTTLGCLRSCLAVSFSILKCVIKVTELDKIYGIFMMNTSYGTAYFWRSETCKVCADFMQPECTVRLVFCKTMSFGKYYVMISQRFKESLLLLRRSRSKKVRNETLFTQKIDIGVSHSM